MLRNESRPGFWLLTRCVLAASGVVVGLPAQGATLVKDIYPGPIGGVCSCGAGLKPGAGPTLYFAADDGVHGIELWKTDGTTAGTVMVKDINPGPASSGAGFVSGSFPLVGGVNVFTADDGLTGQEVWRTDGTASGTYLLKDILPGSRRSQPQRFTRVGREVFFTADNGVNGTELWKTDGTAAGTVMVADIAPGAGSASPNPLIEFDGKAYFGILGSQLWVSDGTAAGTSLVMGGFRGAPNAMAVAAGSLWFTNIWQFAAAEVWKSDGTAAGTVKVATFPYTVFSIPEYYTAVGSTVFFSADDGVHGIELWKTDGTPAGTSLVKDIFPGGSAMPNNLLEFKGKLLFQASDFSLGGVGGPYLHQSDGTVEGTRVLQTVAGPFLPTRAGSDTVYFSGSDLVFGIELWKTDGTTSGTVLAANINPTTSSSPFNLVMSSGELLFIANDGTRGQELWKVFPGATSQEVGAACSASGTAPRLSATDPAYQSAWTISGDGFAAGTVMWLLASFESAPSLLGPCTLYIDPSAWSIFHVEVLAGSTWDLTLQLPTIPALTGQSLVLQALQAPTAAPLGADFSNGVVSTFGVATTL